MADPRLSIVANFRGKSPPKRGVECPYCGSPRTRNTDTGWANDGTIPVHRAKCWDCRGNFVTAEVVVPDVRGVSPFDEIKRMRHRDSHRRRRGFHGGEPRTRRLDSDRLVIRVKVLRGRWANRRAA